MTQIAQSQVETSQRAVIGRFQSGSPMNRAVTSARPSAAGTNQLYTIASGSPANSTTYTLRIVATSLDLDKTLAITTDGTATAAEVESAFATAWNADPELAGLATAAAGTDLTITGLDYTVDLTISGNDAATIALLTITETTAPSAASTFPIGRWVSLSGPSGALAGPRFAAITAPTQSAAAYTITSDASGAYSTVIVAINTITGEQTSLPVSWSGDATPATTYANAEAALLAAFTGTGFTADTASNVVTLTAPVGWDLAVIVTEATGGSAAMTAAVTQPGAIPQLGWVMDPESDSPSSIGGSVSDIAAGMAAPIVLSAPASVVGVEDSGATPTFGGTVYVEAAAGANNGRPYTAQSATGSRIALPKSVAIWNGTDPVDSTVHTILFA